MSDGFDAVQRAGVFRHKEKIVDTDTLPHADLFYAAIVCSIQMARGGRMLTKRKLFWRAVPREIGKKYRIWKPGSIH